MSKEQLLELTSFLPKKSAEHVARFYELLVAENERQNLTRLISPPQFVEGHLIDVLELLKSGLVDYPAMDLGSGGGVPGLLAAILGNESWILCESEGRKASFLAASVQELGLNRVSVASVRAENYLATNSVKSVVARAVGPVDRILGWIDGCSTWNNLVLLKGPGWEEEWKDFERTRFRKRYELSATHAYMVGAESKKRIIVRLNRVPRGTNASG